MLYVLRVLLFGIVFIIGLQKVTKVVFVFGEVGEFKGEHVTEIVAQLIFISLYFKFKKENKKILSIFTKWIY